MASVLKQSFRQKDERNKIPEKRKNDGRAGKADTQKSRNQKLPREKKQKKTKENKRKQGLCRMFLIQIGKLFKM